MFFLGSTAFETVYVWLFGVRYEILGTGISTSFIRLETTPKLKTSYSTFPPNFTATPKLIKIPRIPANSLISSLNTFIPKLILMNSHLTLIRVLFLIRILILILLLMRTIICFDLIYPDLSALWFLSIFLLYISWWVETQRIYWVLSFGVVVTQLSIT